MATLEVHPEIRAREQQRHPDYSTCYECHRSFRARSEDQLFLELCDDCFDAVRYLREPVISVHVKARPRRSLNFERPHS